MDTMETPKEVIFTIKLQPSLAEWLEQRATANRRARLREAFAGVPYMRNRYFSLDLVSRLGLVPALLDRLFGAGGVWEVR